MAIKLHRCAFLFFKTQGHPCWRVQSALDEAGIEYEVVKEPAFPRSRRKEALRLTGQTLVPFIEFEDGTALREESIDLARRIREGRLRPAASGAMASAENPGFGSRDA